MAPGRRTGPGPPPGVLRLGLERIAAVQAQVELMDFASNREPQASRQVDGGEHQSFELVPPEAFRSFKVSGGDEHRGRHVVSLQEGAGLEQIVGVAVIESEDDATPGSATGRECPGQIAKQQRPSVSPHHFQVFGEVQRADGKLPGI